MGVESQFYVLPESSTYRPDVHSVCGLISRFQAEGFLCNPTLRPLEQSVHPCPTPLKNLKSFEGFDWRINQERGVGSLAELEVRILQNEHSDIKLRWSTMNLGRSGLRYPLSQTPASEYVYYDIEIHLAANTVYCTSEIVEPFVEPIQCECGATLEPQEPPAHDFFYGMRLLDVCPGCGKTTNYSVLPMNFRNAWTGVECQGFGGITYRFCVVVDCGKMIPPQGTSVHSDFQKIIEQTIQCPTRIVQDFH